MRTLCCSRWLWFCCLFFISILATPGVVVVAAGEVWLEYGRINSTNATDGNRQGGAVAIQDTTLVVGVPLFNGTGAVFVYELAVDEFVVQQILLPDTATYQFGTSVAISGNTIVVGSTSEDAVYLFVYNSTSMLYEKQQKIIGTVGQSFGHSVAISGDYLVVGTPFDSGSTGVIYIYRRSGTAWLNDGSFTGDDVFYFFGMSVAIDGKTIVVGVPGASANQGKVNTYTRVSSTWTALDVITASDGAADDSFGQYVAMYDSRIVVGAPTALTAGQIYIYTRHFGKALDEVKIRHQDAGTNHDYFGQSVAIMGDTVVVGAPSHTSDIGAAYVFKRNSVVGTWSQVVQLNITVVATGQFGFRVAVNDGFVVIGAPEANGTGLSLVYVEDPATQPPSAQPSQAPSSVPTPAPEYACADFYKQCKDNDKKYMMHKFRGLKDPAKVQLGCRTTCVSKYMVNLYRRQLGWQCGSCLDSLNAKGQGNKHKTS